MLVYQNIKDVRVPLSEPSKSRKRPFKPNKLRKYHDREETHRTSISCVSIPRCIIDLKPIVSGKGSLTVFQREHRLSAGKREKGAILTEDKSLEEEIYPAHNNHLRHHHDHLLLHGLHHAFHGARVC